MKRGEEDRPRGAANGKFPALPPRELRRRLAWYRKVERAARAEPKRARREDSSAIDENRPA